MGTLGWTKFLVDDDLSAQMNPCSLVGPSSHADFDGDLSAQMNSPDIIIRFSNVLQHKPTQECSFF